MKVWLAEKVNFWCKIDVIYQLIHKFLYGTANYKQWCLFHPVFLYINSTLQLWTYAHDSGLMDWWCISNNFITTNVTYPRLQIFLNKFRSDILMSILNGDGFIVFNQASTSTVYDRGGNTSNLWTMRQRESWWLSSTFGLERWLPHYGNVLESLLGSTIYPS